MSVIASDRELELSVRLLEEQEEEEISGGSRGVEEVLNSTSTSSPRRNNTTLRRVLLDEQVVLMKNEAVFQFAPIHSDAQNLHIQVSNTNRTVLDLTHHTYVVRITYVCIPAITYEFYVLVEFYGKYVFLFSFLHRPKKL